MFCSNCGKELDANNVCINPTCPSNSESNSEFYQESSINNNSTIDDVETTEPTIDNNESLNENTSYTQNPGYNQNSNYNQNASYTQNPNYNQNAGYNQNPNYNQNAGYNQGPNYGQNTGYNQGNPFTDKNGVSANEMMDLLGPKNTEYYMDKWNRSQENPNFISWNWPAFLFGVIWLFFRKMYAVAGIVIGISFASWLILPSWGQSMLSLGLMIAFGLLANQIYIKQSIDKIRATKVSTSFNPQILSQRLREIGGITWVPVIIASVLLGLLIIFLIIVIIAAVAFGSSFGGYGNFY